MKALAKNQLNRYQSAGDMRSDLQRALANQPVTAEAVMTDAERTQFIARTPVPPVALPHRDVDEPIDDGHHRRTGLLWLAIVIAMLVVIGGVVAVILVSKGQNNGKPKVAIPTGVVGEQPAQAKAQFTAAKLKLVPDPAGATTNGPCADGSTPSTEGVVCTLFQNSQPVHEGDQVVQNSTVYYQTYVQKKVSVPPVTGLSWNDAATQIHKLGLNPVKKAVNAGGTANQVVAQDPEQFTTVTPGSNVTLSVTTGKYRLPDVTGMKVADAENKLYGKFNNIDDTQTRVTSDQSKDQTVAEESPQPGKAYDPSTKITLIVYKFQQTTPTCSSGGSLPSGGASSPASGLPSGGTTGVPSTGSALPPCTTP